MESYNAEERLIAEQAVKGYRLMKKALGEAEGG